MSISSYNNLIISLLHWLGQPNDPLVTPHVADCIRLFEAEADRRLRTRWRETDAVLSPLTITPLIAGAEVIDPVVALPDDFKSLRSIRLRGIGSSSLEPAPTVNLTYLPPDQLTASEAWYYTIEGLNLRFASALADTDEILITYQQGLTPLAPNVMSNWLLREHPDAYLFGALAELEAFVANDERVAGALARREAIFASILDEDRRSRVGGGKLVIRPDIAFPLGRRVRSPTPVW